MGWPDGDGCECSSFHSGKAGVLTTNSFILEGIPAILCGIYTFFFLPNYPGAKSKFLSEAETELLKDDHPKTQAKSDAATWNSKEVMALLRDPTFVTFTLVWVCHAIGGWGISTVLPTVIHDLGLTDTAISQLMTMVSTKPRSRGRRSIG